MTILDKIIKFVHENGVVTLQQIYEEFPEIKQTVIRGTINRYVKKTSRLIERCTRGIYVAILKVEKNIINLGNSTIKKRKDILSKFKYLLQQPTKKSTSNFKMVAGLEGQISIDDLDYIYQSEDSVYDDFDSIQNFNLNDKMAMLDEDDSKLIRLNTVSNEPCIDKNDIRFFDNKIFGEDSREWLKTIPDESIDLVISDPPYPVTKRGIGKRTNSGGMMRNQLTSQGKIFKHNDIKFSEYIPELFRVLKDGSHCYIMTNHKNLIELLNTCVEAGFSFIKSLIWMKNNKGLGQFYQSQFEYILFFRKGKSVRINNCGTSDILEFRNDKTKMPKLDENGEQVFSAKGKPLFENLHDTEKPVGLMQVLIENSSKIGQRVLDPFIGIGAVALACKKLGRIFIGNEIDEKYRTISLKRLDEIDVVMI